MERIASRGAVLAVVALLAGVVLTSPARAAVTLRLLDWQLAEEPTGTTIKGIVKEFEATHPGVTVELEPVPFAQHVPKFVTQTKANQAPDVVRIVDGATTNIMAMGAAHKMDPLIQQYGGGQDLKEQLVPSLLQFATYRNEWYGMPHWAVPMMQFYNTELFRKAGLDPNKPPQTFAEFAAATQKLTVKDASGKPVQWGYMFRGEKTVTATSRLVSWWLRNGARILSDDNKRAVLNSPEGKEVFRFVVELYTKLGVVPPGVPEAGGGQLVTAFATEKVAIIQVPYVQVDLVEGVRPGMRQKVAVARMPGKVDTTTVLSGVYFVSSQTKHPKEAWELFKALNSKDAQLKMFTTANFIPSRRDALTAPEVVNSKFGPVQADALRKVTLLPAIPEWPQISDILMETFHAALAGRDDPGALLDKAADRINQVLPK
jgi:ABC-type glycerol-3-phosphate transport system substrate-binding protein